MNATLEFILLTQSPALFLAAIVLLTLSMTNQGAHQNGWLCGGLLCSTLGIWLNIWFQRKERKKEQ